MTEQIPTSEVLNRAADLIEERGWWTRSQGSVDAGGGTAEAWCVINAITRTANAPGTPAHRALAAHLGFASSCDVFDWNDAPERTAAEVIEVLRATALIEAARENADVRESVSA